MREAFSAFAGAIGGTLPFAILLGIIFWLLRKRIEEVMGNITSLTIAGQKAVIAKPQQQTASQPEPQILPAASPGRPESPPPVIPFYDALEQDIRRRLEITAPGDLEVQRAWAIRIAANAMIDRDMEVTYRLIFGSQITALKEANMRGGFITVGRAQEIYEQAKELHPALYAAMDFAAWAEFPIIRNLITKPEEPVTPNSKANLTEAGKQFLLFITAKGLLDVKYG